MDKSNKSPLKKKGYKSPEITSDDLELFGQAGGGGGGTCNGTTTGGRKSITGAPENCTSTKLKT